MQIDGHGKVLNKDENNNNMSNRLITTASNEVDNLLLKTNSNKQEENKKEYKSIHDYKPSGNMIYNEDLLNKTMTKINR